MIKINISKHNLKVPDDAKRIIDAIYRAMGDNPKKREGDNALLLAGANILWEIVDEMRLKEVTLQGPEFSEDENGENS